MHRIALIEVLWVLIIGLGFFLKTWNAYDAQRDLEVLRDTGRNGFRMKLATGARDADILRALAMFGLLIPGIISLFVFNPVNRDPTPWHSYVSLTALISAGVIFTLVSIRSRLTRKAVMAEALRIDETLPVDEVKGIAHDQAEEAANRVLNYIETRDAQQENTRQDLETERKREES